MSMPSGGDMKEGADEIPGLHVEAIHSRDELKKVRSEIAEGLRNDAVNDNYDPLGESGERKSTMKGIEKHLQYGEFHSGEHEHVFVAKIGEKVTGLLVVKTTDSGKKAEIEELWTRSRSQSQRPVALKLFQKAKSELAEDQFRQLTVEVDNDSPSDILASAARQSGLQYFLKVRRSEQAEAPEAADDDRNPLEKAA